MPMACWPNTSAQKSPDYGNERITNWWTQSIGHKAGLWPILVLTRRKTPPEETNETKGLRGTDISKENEKNGRKRPVKKGFSRLTRCW
jgi:hypothetical protein